jgi:hypothetical protein
VNLLDVKLAHSASFYQLDGVLESRKPVEAMLEGFTNQRARRCVVAALATMYLYK